MIGKLLRDRFLIEERLASGGFGVTYRALDRKQERPVVVKELRLDEVSDWKSLELFEREARVLRDLDHKKIPDYIAYVTDEAGQRSFLVQELAPGADLKVMLASQGRFSEGATKKIAEEILEILIYLGSRRPPVVHRDIKPANLILSEDDGIYLVDFGAVKDVARRGGDGDTVAGTFGYMAPEQLQGEAIVASDLYALGMTLIHLVSGRAPEQMEKRRLKVDFRRYCDISEAFAAFLDRLIEPMAEDRFVTAAEALEYLRRPWAAPSLTAPAGLLPAGPDSGTPWMPTERELQELIEELVFEQGLRAGQQWIAKNLPGDRGEEALKWAEGATRLKLADLLNHQGQEVARRWIDNQIHQRDQQEFFTFLKKVQQKRETKRRCVRRDLCDGRPVMHLDGESHLRSIGIVASAFVVLFAFIGGGMWWFGAAAPTIGVVFLVHLLMSLIIGYVARSKMMAMTVDESGRCRVYDRRTGEQRWVGAPDQVAISTTMDTTGSADFEIKIDGVSYYHRIFAHPDDVVELLRFRQILAGQGVLSPPRASQLPLDRSDDRGADEAMKSVSQEVVEEIPLNTRSH